MAEEKQTAKKGESKKKDKTNDKTQTPDEKDALTEWQKRNVEFLKKQKERKEDQKRELEKQRELLKKIGAIPTSEELLEAEKADDSAKEKNSEPSFGKQFSEKVRAIQRPKISFRSLFSVTKRPLFKGVVVIIGSSLVLGVSLYFITPLGSAKQIEITGNTTVSHEEILKASKIRSTDYTLKTAIDMKQIAERIKTSTAWIKTVQMTYHWPDRFDIAVDDYAILGYRQSGDSYVPVYENGVKGMTQSSTQLPSQYLTINLDNESQIQELVRQMKGLSSNLRDNIQTVDLAPTAATTDLLKLTMRNGNTVLVPLSQLGKKLPYYSRIANTLSSPVTVDMEVGIYTATEDSSSSSNIANSEATEAGSDQTAAEEATATDSNAPAEIADNTAPDPAVAGSEDPSVQ